MRQNDCKKSQQIITRLKWAVFILLGLIIVVQNVFADTEKPKVISITKSVKVLRGVPAEVSKKKLFFLVENNEYFTNYINTLARSKGINVADRAEVADEIFTVGGGIMLHGGGIKEAKITYDKLDEKLLTSSFEGKEVQSSESIRADQVALTAAVAGIKSVVGLTDALTYISQITGISGAFNKAITGDARGICYGELCDNFGHNMFMAFRNQNVMWYSKTNIVYPTLYISGAIGEQLNIMFEPLLTKGQE